MFQMILTNKKIVLSEPGYVSDHFKQQQKNVQDPLKEIEKKNENLFQKMIARKRNIFDQ